MHYVDSGQIRELLKPYTLDLSPPLAIYDQLSAYLDLLVRWNARTNLTAVRDPKHIVTRHFGESLFAAQVLVVECGLGAAPQPGGPHRPVVGSSAGAPLKPSFGLSGTQEPPPGSTLADFGSGAGFPGLPIKLVVPSLHVTLIESQNKKATFLKEVIRALGLEGVEVFNGRAEQWGKTADFVTMRAVDKFESMLPVARQLLRPGGRLCALTTSGVGENLKWGPFFEFEVEEDLPLASVGIVRVGIAV
jgi:16S rRNA (guanine527-N7)-methyltransferase